MHVGESVGCIRGCHDGCEVGSLEGCRDGRKYGTALGLNVGATVGVNDGLNLKTKTITIEKIIDNCLHCLPCGRHSAGLLCRNRRRLKGWIARRKMYWLN